MEGEEAEPDYTTGATGDGWGGRPYRHVKTGWQSGTIETSLNPQETEWRGKPPPRRNRDREEFSRDFLPLLSQAYLFEKHGGNPREVLIRSEIGEIWIDYVDPKGTLHEAKTSIVSDDPQSVRQLWKYTRYLSEHPKKNLFYHFFASPSRENFGPTTAFMFRLAEESKLHNIGVVIHPAGWWDELQRVHQKRRN